MTPRIWSGGGGLSQAVADGLYVKKTGDTMTGNLNMNNPTPTNNGNAPSQNFHGSDLSANDISSSWVLGWAASQADHVLAVAYGLGTAGLQVSVPLNATGFIEVTATTIRPHLTSVWDLGTSSLKWRDLFLSGDLSIGDDVLPSADEVTDVGDTTNGVRQIVFSDASSGSNRARFRGNKCIGYAGADIYWGVDDVFPGFFVQKTVVAGSTATDNSQDYTNLYQGDSNYQFIAMQFALGRTVDANGNPTNGIVISDSGPGTLGCPIVWKAGTGRLFEAYLDQTNSVFRMECGKTTTTRIPKLEIRLAGTAPAIRPHADNATDFGESSLAWKDGYFKGDVRGRQLIATGDNAGVASTNSLTNVSDFTTNSTGVGTIKFKGTTSRDSAGFLKVYVGTTAYYVPAFDAITG